MSFTKSISRIISIAILIVFLLMSALPVQPVFAAATFTVNSNLDEIDDDTSDGVCHTAVNTCTLRAAIMQANKMTGPGVTINLPAGTYTLTRPPAGVNGDDNGDLNLTAPTSGDPVITIIGAGANLTIIDANQLDRVLKIAAERTASIAGVTVSNGYNDSSLGGGIHNLGTLTLSNSSISGNQGTWGGGIFNDENLTVVNSTISSNQSTWGGGINNDGNLTVVNSTISSNQSVWGGGIDNSANLIVVNSTISQNNADLNGGGIDNYGTANIYNTTIFFNGADADVDYNGHGGGVYIDPFSTFAIRNTLVAGNHLSDAPVYEDCYGDIFSYGRNLLWDVNNCTVYSASGGWMLLNSLSSIGPLKNNGGPTWTHAILPGSNAIDGGDPDLGCVDSASILLATDQRGAARVVGAFCDIGAYEYAPPVTLKSLGSNDGWILESTETSAAGGTLNASATTFNLGDNAADKQYRAILHFDTSSLPDNAVITRVTFRIRKQGLVGTDPFTTHGKIVVDIRKGAFGNNNTLQAGDFQSTAHKNAGATIQNAPVNNWYSVNFPASAFAFLNKAGVTQFRLRFQTDDNNDNGADYLKFFSGNVANAIARPTLIIEYYLP